MKKDRGFTLVEVMVVLAIMAVLTGAIGLSLSVIAGQRLKSAVSDTKSLMQSAQTVAMSKKDCVVEFVQNSDGECVITSKVNGGDKQLKEIVVHKKISISVKTVDGTSYNVGSDNTVTIFYNRETGGFAKCQVNGVEKDIPAEISFSKGDRTIVLELATYTGKISQK